MSAVTDDYERVTLSRLHRLCMNALTASGASAAAADSVAQAYVAAEAEGLKNHGVARLPLLCEMLAHGKIDGAAVPQVSYSAPSVVVVDAADGLAHPAIDAGMEAFQSVVHGNGVGVLAIVNSFSCHVLGYHTERMSDRGMVALGFCNGPSAIAPPGARRAFLGTNPMSYSVPRSGAAPITCDQAASVVAKSEIVDRAAADEPIPLGWAIDEEGTETKSAAAALRGAMLPFGGYKGFNIAFLSEIMAAVVTGGALGIDSRPFADLASGPMRLGQFFVGIDIDAVTPRATKEASLDKLETALASLGGRLPGSRRHASRIEAEAKGVLISRSALDALASAGAAAS